MLCTNTARAGLALALGMALALGGAAAVAAVPHQALAKVPAKVTGVTASGASTSSVKVSWKKVSGVTGYQVKIGTKKTFSGANTVRTSLDSRSFRALTCGKRYYFKVRAYKALGGRSCSYGSWSGTVCGATKPSKVTSLYVKKTSCYKRFLMTWDKIPGATGYQIQYGKGAKTSKTLTTKAKGKKYLTVPRNTDWIKVRAYVQGTRKTYGAWSDKKATPSGRDGTLERFSWKQLKSFSNQIARAGSAQEALAKAKELGLVEKSGRLTGNEYKCVTLSDGTHCHVQILGFWHDKKTSGERAGITFGFKEGVARHAANMKLTTSGGWQNSDMRAWLNNAFYDSLPYDLRSRIASVRKLTNNTGDTTSLSAVTVTSDKLWLLSPTECVGSLDGSRFSKELRRICEAEGFQYRLYASKKVTFSSSSLLAKTDASSKGTCWWWLRSPVSDMSFFVIAHNGRCTGYTANHPFYVSPGFCF